MEYNGNISICFLELIAWFVNNFKVIDERKNMLIIVIEGWIELYKIYFYRNRNGNQPVLEHIKNLAEKKDKNSRIQLNKIQDAIQILKQHGTFAGEPFVKHLEGDIWELRALRDRILFVAWVQNSYVLLHHFMKTTQKTPRREIMQAKRELSDLIERTAEDGEK